MIILRIVCVVVWRRTWRIGLVVCKMLSIKAKIVTTTTKCKNNHNIPASKTKQQKVTTIIKMIPYKFRTTKNGTKAGAGATKSNLRNKDRNKNRNRNK